MHIPLLKMNVNSFYKKSMQIHTLLKCAVDFVASEVEGPTDVIIVGPTTGEEVSDVKLNNDEDLTENNTLSAEVACEIDMFFEEEKEKEVEVPPTKKKSKKDEANLERKKILPVIKNENIRTNIEDKIYLSNRLHEEFPEVQNGTEWSVFQLVFDNIIDLLVQNTNLYAPRDKSNTKFKVSKD